MKGELIQFDLEEEQNKELKESEVDLGDGEQEEVEVETQEQEEIDIDLLGTAAPRPMRETRQSLTFKALGNFKLKNKKMTAKQLQIFSANINGLKNPSKRQKTLTIEIGYYLIARNPY